MAPLIAEVVALKQAQTCRVTMINPAALSSGTGTLFRKNVLFSSLDNKKHILFEYNLRS